MLSRIEVLYYKGLKYVDVPLKNFLLLVGPNSSGKSTFLDTFTLIRDILNEGPQSAIEHRSSHFKELVWKQEEEGIECVLEFLIPEEISDIFEGARYEISLIDDKTKGVIVKNENLYLVQKGTNWSQSASRKPRQLALFPVEPEPPEHIVTSRMPHGGRRIISKSPQGNDYFYSENTGWNITYRFGPKKASLGSIPEDEQRFPITLWLKRFLTEGIKFLRLNSIAMHSPCRPDAPLSLQMDGANLPKVIKHLKEVNKEHFDLWIKHIRSALPEIENIDIKERPEDRYLYIYAQNKGGINIPSWLLSDGTLRFLAQTLIAYLPIKDHIFLIEEPENALHPLAIESTYKSLSSVYENQIIMATHSPAILRLAEPENILCFSKTASGAIDIIHGDEHPKLKDWRQGVDLATLHASGVLQ